MKPGIGDPFFDYDRRPDADLQPTNFELVKPAPDPGFAEQGPGAPATAGGSPAQDENSEADHPFAIQIEITTQSPSSKSWSADVTVLEGKYKTDGDTEYTAAEVTQSFTTSSGTIKPYVYLYVPLVPDGTGGWTAVDGGFIMFGANRPSAVWPQVQRTPSGVTDYGTTVQIGAWTIQIANISGGVATYGYRAVINQIIAEDYVLEQVELVTGPRTFFATASGADVTVSAGAINNEIAPEYTATPADGDKFYIDVEMDAFDGVVAVEIAHAASVPANTTTHGYTLLASVAVADGIATVTPLAWNYSQVQKCGDTKYLWGGFGS